MNERIRQLAEQSGFVNLNANYWDCTSDGIEKLAELIVRECADIGNKAYSDIGPYGYIGEKIKEHFGVEE